MQRTPKYASLLRVRALCLRPFYEAVPDSRLRVFSAAAKAFLRMTDIRTILHRTTRDLAAGGSPSPRLDAEVLLMRFLGMDRLQLCMHPERELSQEEAAGFVRWVKRRNLGEPIAYILGEKEFWSLRFEVGREVLIPRPETECLIEEVLRFYRTPGEGLRIFDIGTGSGAIGVVLARELPAARVAATDVSPGAIAVACRNAVAHGVAGRMEFFEGDLFAAVSGDWDIICSNPPYVQEDQYELLPAGIRNFEPREAFIAGPDGTAFHRRIIREGAHRLKAEGRIFLEIGEGQEGLVDSLFREAGCYADISFR
ncbi:MAG: peptide chain release factor N(5)-glutamine methyltransferase, partial [Deltaproteobacteria bacterium]|nr:peptide chain release factor N(5)-glutamine methyltransferase [Deltaproteobacteria bacterium]